VTARAFGLTEVGSPPQGLEILIEGDLELGAGAVCGNALERALDVDPRHVMVDLDRCGLIDPVSVKFRVVAREHLPCRREELLIFGATGQVGGALEAIGAFDDRVLISAGDPAAACGPSAAAVPTQAGRGRMRGALSRLRPRFTSRRHIEASTRGEVQQTIASGRRPEEFREAGGGDVPGL
jgi:hypothetical protein